MKTLMIKDAISLLRLIRKSETVTILFTKKDKSLRLMKCTLDYKKIPPEFHPKEYKPEQALKLIKQNILRVFDIEKQGWRSIPVDRSEFVVSGDVRYQIQLNLEEEKKKKEKYTEWAF